jgi:3-oxoacyl-[acyl-carrier protein] reductase
MTQVSMKGKSALVSGASRGIGRAVAVALAGEGARVGLGGRDEGALAETARLVREAGGEALVLPLDVTSEGSVREAWKTFQAAYGALDCLINNAGVTRDGLLVRTKTQDWQTVLDTNLGGVFRLTREVLPAMLRARGGRIVSISSVIAESGNAGQTTYAASKAGIIGFTRSLAREVASRAITVNCVAPGYIETEMTADLPDKVREGMLASIPLGRAGTAAEVAACVCFLLSDAAAYVTGATLRVNGGLYM